jgi:hypothetical protein
MEEKPEYQEMQEMLDFVRNDLTVYEDVENPHVYYYMPKFVAVPGRAATVTVNDKALARRKEILELTNKILNMNTSYALSLARRRSEVSDKLASMEEKQPEQTEKIKLLRQILEDIQAELKQFDESTEQKLGQFYQKSAYQQLANLLGLSGFPLSEADIKNTLKRTEVLAKLSASNGGKFAVNIHASLGKQAKKLVRKYHQERNFLKLPRIRILKLPVEKITWEALAETVYNTTGQKQNVGIPLPRKISGAGHLDGTTINMDLTLDGAAKFLSANPPVILPVYAKVKTLKKYPPFRAVLECDYSVGWSVKGRVDLKDGLVIFDNDVYKQMVVSDDINVKKPCNIRVIEGERKYAELVALEALEKKFKDILMERVNLTQSEKNTYYQKMMKDVQQTSESKISDDFFWHTHTEDMKKLSTFKWKEELVSTGLKSVVVDVPVRLCVVFKPTKNRQDLNVEEYQKLYEQYKAMGLEDVIRNRIREEVKLSSLIGGKYVACSDEEEDKATTVTDAYEKSMNSQECNGMTSVIECGKKRAQEAPTNPITGNVESFPDEL